jgi:hypothetical protein
VTDRSIEQERSIVAALARRLSRPCSECNAPVYWATTMIGRRLLMDVTCAPGRQRYVVYLHQDDETFTLFASRAKPPDAWASSHFDTCEKRRRGMPASKLTERGKGTA